MNEKQKHSSSRVITFHPDGDYYFQKSVTAYQKGDLHRARKLMNRAIGFQPKEVEYLCQQAAISAELEDYEASNDLLKKVVHELDPDLSECYFFMANNYAYMGKFEEALHAVRTYLMLEPKGPFIQEAKELYRLIHSETSASYEEDEEYVADHEKGRQALQKGQFKKAIALFKKVLDEKPEFWAAANNLAIAYFSLGDEASAHKTIRHILSNDPGNVNALCNLATFFHNAGESDLLKEILTMMDRLYPFYPDHRMKLGSAYFFVGEYKKALHWLKSAEKSGAYPDQIAHFWMALSYWRTGNTHGALKAYDRMDYFSEQSLHPLQYGMIKKMLLEDDRRENPLVRKLIEDALMDKDHHSYQIFSIYYLVFLNDEKARLLLNRFAEQTDSHLLKAIAKTARDPKAAKNEDQRSYQVMLELEAYLGKGLPMIEDPDIYSWWAMVFEMNHGRDNVDIKGWAAALAYLWLKETGHKTTQKSVAQDFDVTIYTLHKHVEQLKKSLIY